ncbi:hypothetical protein D3C86_1900710 [compost metagenome]
MIGAGRTCIGFIDEVVMGTGDFFRYLLGQIGPGLHRHGIRFGAWGIGLFTMATLVIGIGAAHANFFFGQLVPGFQRVVVNRPVTTVPIERF